MGVGGSFFIIFYNLEDLSSYFVDFLLKEIWSEIEIWFDFIYLLFRIFKCVVIIVIDSSFFVKFFVLNVFIVFMLLFKVIVLYIVFIIKIF